MPVGTAGYVSRMATNTRDIAATPDQVWDVLSDGWLYPLWVVGATRMRDVDDTWPAVGSALHHSVGVWPMVVDDETRVLEVSPRQSIRLRAKAWPGGEAEVLITLEARGEKTRVAIHETADAPKTPDAAAGKVVTRPAPDAPSTPHEHAH